MAQMTMFCDAEGFVAGNEGIGQVYFFQINKCGSVTSNSRTV